FAFIVWDASSRTLFAVRDAMGTRPLWFARGAGVLAVASEEAALRAVPGISGALDPHSVLALLRGEGHDAARGTFAGVTRVEPGQLLRITADSEQRVRWFYPPAAAGPTLGETRPHPDH